MGTKDKTYYIPWMQATYVLAINKKALQYLPQGADVNALTYQQLKDWGAAIQKATNKRLLGFPAGPKGLLHRFFQGYLYPSYTGSSGVVGFKTPEAAAMWKDFKDIWQYVNPQSTNYEFMQEPLASEEVWIAWDHVARLINVAQRPAERLRAGAGAGRTEGPRLHARAGRAGHPEGRAEPRRRRAADRLPDPAPAAVQHRGATGLLPGDQRAGPVRAESGHQARSRRGAEAVRRPRMRCRRCCRSAWAPRAATSTTSTWTRSSASSSRTRTSRPSWTRRPRPCRAIMDETKAGCWAPDPPSDGPCKVK